MGDVTLENFLVTHGLIPQQLGSGVKVLVTRFDDVPYEAYLSLTDTLRNEGVPCSLYLGSKKFGKQIEYAVKGGYTHVIILGGSEWESGTVKVKNLNTREEQTIDRDKLLSLLQ